MKRKIQRENDDRFAAKGVRSGTVFLFFAFSGVCHLILLALLFLMPQLAPAKKFTPSVVNVSLVSFPAKEQPAAPAAPAAPAQKPVVKTAKPKKLQPAKEKSTKEPVVSTSKKKIKKSLKYKTFKRSKVVKSAVSRLEEQVQDARHPSLQETLDRLRQEVEKTEANPQLKSKTIEDKTTPGSGAAAGSELSSAETLDRIRIYQAEITYQIQKNWAFSEQIAGADKNLEVLLGIKIMPNGEIAEIWFDQKSGNRHLDESSHRAVMKSRPLPALPKGLFDSYYTVGLRFGPEGLKR
jgi:outer membrane biosynthesis protein TonB